MSRARIKLTPLVLCLGLISCTAAALLAWVFMITEAPIRAAMQQKTNTALGQVLPSFDNQPAQEAVTFGDVKFYTARKEGKITGFAGEAVSPKGYAGGVTVLAGLQPDGTVTTVLVTKQSETPGLGTVVCDRKREKTLSGLLAGKKETGLPPNPVLDQFSGLKAEAGQAPWKVKKDGGTLDAVTGATISSRAVADGVFMIVKSFTENRALLLTEEK